jgi:hypothetical protein
MQFSKGCKLKSFTAENLEESFIRENQGIYTISMHNKTISSDSHHFIIINDGNIKIHQSWISCYGKEFWDGTEVENKHYLEKCLGKKEGISLAKEHYGMGKNLPAEFLNELYRIIKSKPTYAQDINNFCKKYCGVPLTRIEDGPIVVNFDITYYDFPLCSR